MPTTVPHGPEFGLLEQGEHLADAGAEAFVAAFEPFQHLDAAGQAAALGAQIAQ